MSKSLVSVFLLGACATGSVGIDREAGPVTGVHLELSAEAQQAFHPARALELPSADAMSFRVRDRLGDEPSVKVDMCVAPDGKVRSIALVSGTTMEMFDQAVLRDAATWQFAASEVSAAEACTRTTIVYRPRKG